MAEAPDQAIEALAVALAQLEPGTVVHDHVVQAHRALAQRRPPSREQAGFAIDRAIAAAGVRSEVHDALLTAWAAVRPSAVAIPIDMVTEYVTRRTVQAEAAVERGRAAFEPIQRMRERADYLRYVSGRLSLAEEAGVGAVLTPAIDEALFDQVVLLGEQLFWQDQIDVVPSTLTEYAVRPPFRKSGSGEISADRSIWCRQQLG